MKKICFILFCLLISSIISSAQNPPMLTKNPNFFPIGVWLQSPENAAAYRKAGINVNIGVWKGLTQESLDMYKKAGMKIICDQNEFGLKNLKDTTILGWMHNDEPDNAQAKRNGGQGYDPCIDPAIIIKSYEDIKKKDPSRPVYINLGQGVSYINYNGRGECRGNIDKYKESTNGYLKGCDLASFDIYPVNNRDPESHNNLWYVPKGIDSLRSWTNYKKPVWCVIECTKIGQGNPRKPTTMEVNSEVWMAIIHGANGYSFFCHSFVNPQDEAALLHDADMLKSVTATNKLVTSLAPVLNSPTTNDYATVTSTNKDVPVDIMTKSQGKANYIFSVGMRCGFTTATFSVKSGNNVEVIGEGRTLKVTDGKFSDEFAPYGVHLYKVL
jgi:hypothetical protein